MVVNCTRFQKATFNLSIERTRYGEIRAALKNWAAVLLQCCYADGGPTAFVPVWIFHSSNELWLA